MYEIAKLPGEEREILFLNTASKMGMNAAIIEKDFWVCLTLDYLFHKNQWMKAFAFKGGTSLSKVYSLIDRFSEDIDLILDWRTVGYGYSEPWEKRSNTQQQKFIAESSNRVAAFLKDKFLPVFLADITDCVGRSVSVYLDDDEPGTLRFGYPRAFEDPSILQEIRLEIGALAAWTPTQLSDIHPYAADYYPKVFHQAYTQVLTTTAERTFWEKATILHQEAHRVESSKVPERYSRHYYDLYCMAHKGVLEKALEQKDLLTQVAEFKRTFYPRKWAQYEHAKIGTLKLVPAAHSMDQLRSDYAKMQSMIYGNRPSFDEMMQFIKELEVRINSAV
ncbi:MAG: nucleotidyl transferase AbiEii/AbiGii toxin family protein [Oscillospiraceae bacterium]|nr:nucleotidyl transferase AbiEii/AbiGii toxin family protein [Oscillospiraceae bacterium]